MGIFSTLQKTLQNKETPNLDWFKRLQANTTNKTPYQNNISKVTNPIEVESHANNIEWNTRSTLARINEIWEDDQEYAQDMFNDFLTLQQKPTSKYYNPYSQATNPAVKQLAALGFTDLDINDDWFDRYSDLKQYYKYTPNTNSLSSTMTNKRSSPYEKAAYYYHQLDMEREKTSAALRERQALTEEITALAQMPDRNWSDQEILDMIDWEKKYPTLNEMRIKAKKGTPVEINTSVDPSDDYNWGVLWAARNGGSTGNPYLDIANSYAGTGWKENKELRAKLQKGSTEYSPYSVGSTMEEERKYFGEVSFNQQWLDDNKAKYLNGDKTDQKMYSKVWEAEQTTHQAELQLEELNKQVDKWINSTLDEKEILNKLDVLLAKSNYSLLAKMDKTIDSGADPIDTTRAIDYRKADIVRKIQEGVANRGKSSDETIEDLTANKSAVEIQKEAEELATKAKPESNNTNGSIPLAVMEGANANKGPTQEDFRAAYDAKYGTGAYNRDMAAASKAHQATGTELNEQTQNARVASVSDILWGHMTDKDQKFFAAMPGVQAMRVADAITIARNAATMKGPVNENSRNPEWVANLALKQAQSADDKYLQTGLSSLGVTRPYETAQAEADKLRTQISEIETNFGTKMLAREVIDDETSMSLDPTSDIEISFILDDDNKYIPDPLYDYEDNPAIAEYLALHDMTEQDLVKKLNDMADQLNIHADAIRAAHDEYPDLTEDEIAEMPTREQLEILKNKLSNKEQYLSEHEADYLAAKKELDAANKHREMINEISARVGGKYSNLAVTNGILDFVGSFTDYEVPQDGYDSVITNLDTKYAAGKLTDEDRTAITGDVQELDEAILDAKYILDNYNIPDEYRANIEAYANWLSSRKLTYEAFLFSRDDDFESYVEEGKDRYIDLATSVSVTDGYTSELGETKNGFAFMTPTEQDIYYALFARDGVEAADKYYDALDGTLLTRLQTDIQGGAKESAESGVLGRAFNLAVSIASVPADILGSVAYMVDTAINGKGNEWLRVLGYTGKAAASEITNAINEQYGDSLKGKLISGLYEIVNNRGRSAMAAATFGWLFPEGTSEVVQAFPIATSAMADKLEECLNADIEPWRAWVLALSTFAAESMTEGIELGNMKAAFSSGVNLGTYKEFFQSLIPEAMQEVLGEDLNDMVEKAFDNWFAGEGKTEREKAIKAYEDAGYLTEDAKMMVMVDEFTDLLHTTVVSAFSPGADVALFTAGKLATHLDYANQVQQRRRMGDAQTTIRSLRNNDIQRVQADAEAQEQLLNRELKPFYANEEEQTGENPAEAQKAAQSVFDTDITILENSQASDQTTKTATVAAVLRTDEGNINQASAASVAMSDVFGADTIGALQNLLDGGRTAGTDINTLKTGIQYASLADGQCRAVVNSEAFKNAAPAEQATMLSEAVQEDAASEAVQEQIGKEVHAFRVSLAKQRLMADGQGEAAETAQKKANAVVMETQKAQDRLETQQDVEKAAADEMTKASANLRENPTPENRSRLKQAVDEQKKASSVTQEYEQSLENAREGEQETVAESEKVIKDTAMDIDRQAEDIVAQEEAQEAEQRKVEEEVRAKAEAAQRETNNVTRMDADDFIRRYFPNATDEEKTTIRDQFRAIRSEMGMTADALLERGKFARAVGKKFGVNITVQDTTQGGKVSRQNAYVDVNTGNIVLDTTATMDDMMYAVLTHELTHIAEKSGTYGELADALIRMEYGEDTGRLEADVRARKSLYDTRLAQMHEQDNSIDATPLTEEQAKQEIVADLMGKVLSGDQTLIDNFAKEEPSLARRILDSIKSFLKKMVGIEGAPISQAQNVVNMLETALKDAQANSSQQNGKVKFSLKSFEDGKRFVDIDIMQNEFDNLSPDEMRKKARDIIREYFMGNVIGIDNKAFVNGQTANEYAFPSKFISDDEAKIKMRASTELDNLIDAGKYDRHEEDGRDGHFHKKVIGGFDYYKTIFKIGNEYFEGEVNIANLNKGKKFHDVTKIRNITQDIMSSYGQNPKSQFLRNVSMENVAQDKRTVKPLATDDQGNDTAFELPGNTADASPVIKHSLSSFTPEEQQKVREALLKSGRYTRQEVDKYLNDAMGIASMISADRDRLDFTADPTKTMLKPNAEYVKTLDASTLCAKRLLYQGTFNAIQHALPNTPLMPEDLIDLANMMRDMGYETPCGICYVESRRRQLGKFTEQWLESYDGEYKPTLDQVTTSDGLEELRNTHPQAYQDFINAMNKKGTMNPKVVQLRTDYRGEIRDMTPGQIQKVKDIGGLRVQSFSDFEVPHLLDMAQAVMDMAAKNLTAQAYTKVPNFPWAFGDTGIKINLSLIGAGTGVDENGNLVFDDVEGMPFEEAMKLRNRYSKNVGTILVGINDDHIKAAMADPRIDFIIPFHKSGWSKEELSKMPVLNSYSDYTDSQNEKKIVGRNKNGGYKTESLEKSKQVNFQPVGENGYWDFGKSGKENAEEYLRMCAEDGRLPKFSQFLVDNGDGSFSLQPDGSTDGYWKMLIDFKMYDNEGNGAPQQEVTPNINMPEAMRILNEYSLDRNGISRQSNNDLPVAQPVVDRYVDEYKANHPRRKYSLPSAEAQEADNGEQYNNRYRYSLPSDEEENRLRGLYEDAHKRSMDLSKKYRDIQNSDEYKAWEERIRNTPTEELDKILDEYKQWDSDVGLSETSNAKKTADQERADTLKALENYIEERDVAQEQKDIAESGMTEPDWRRKQAVNEFGYTTNLKEAGYLLPNGKMLNFSGEKGKHYGYRAEDHRGIGRIYASGEIQGTRAMNTFMNGGNIRMMPESPGIDISTAVEPTKEQYAVIRNMARQFADDEYFNVDLSDENGRSVGNLEYEGRIYPERIVNEIKRFFQTGEVPEQSSLSQFRYSLPSDAPYLSAVNHGDMEAAQEMVDQKAEEAGYTKAGFHGTLSGGFTIFDKAKAGIGGNSGAGFYFSSNQEDSDANYSDVEGADNWYKANHLADRILEEFQNSDEEEFEYEGYEITEGMPYDEVVEIAKKILRKNPQTYNVYLDQGKTYIRDFKNSTNLLENVDFDESNYDPDDYDNEDDYYDELSMARSDAIYQAIYDAVYDGIADVESNYEIYSNVNYEDIINQLSEIAIDYETLTWDDLIKVLEDQYIDIGTESMDGSADGSHEIARAIVEAFGYDSIEDREVSKKFNQLKNMGNAGDTVHYIMFRPDQIKLADPVTYDSEGNVIPLSERFRHESNDIRYSLPSENLLNQQIRQYMERGGSLMEDENLPGNPLPEEGGSAQRQFGRRTAQTSDSLHQEVKDYLYTHSSYTPDSNQAQIDRAMDWVQSRATADDPDGYQAAVNEVTSDSFDYRSADGQARMLTVMGMAALKNDLNTELRLADAYNKQGTDLGRQLQARKIFRLMTPIGRQATLQRMADQINDQYAKEGKTTRVKLSDWTLLAAGEAQTEEEFQRVQHAASQELAEQMPANWKDKLRGWRMLSMLGAPRTHIRNVVGNALFVPAVSMKNKLGAVMELGMEKGQRTKTLAPILSKEVRDFAKQDALTMKDTLTGEAKYNENSMVEREQKPFKGLLQAVIDFNSDMLEKEDWTFLKGHYKRALGGWMQANGYTASDMKNNPALLEKGRTYAVQEAQKATYRDFNKLAATLNQASRNGGITGFLVDAVLPFKKTPANILKRGIEYSPIGIMKSLTTDLYHLKQWNDYKSGKLSALPDKAISPNQFIDDLCSGLTGTAVMAVGALLGHAGIVTCGLDDDDDKNEKEQGNQKYSIKFSIAGHDYTYTVDWAAPMAMPFFVGAAIQEQMANQDGFDIEQLINAFGNITEPVFNLSMLDGVNTLFKTSQYDDTNTITQIGAKIASNYATSYVPSLLGAIARTVDDKSRKSFVEQGKGTGVLGTFRYAWEQTENKIPGLSQTNIPIRDIWGNEKTSSLAERIFENFISPGYIEEYKNDPVLKEMANLYELTGNTDMIPKSDPNKTITDKKGKHVLSAEQWDQYKANRNQTAYKMLKELINDPGYQNATDPNVQARMIDKVWDYADDVGKKAVFPDYELKQNPNIIKSVVHDENVSAYNANMLKSLESGDYEGYETMIEALHQEGVEDKDIKREIGDKYRDQYKDAYKKGDWERMSEIEALLDNTGFDFDLNAWEEQVDKKRGN